MAVIVFLVILSGHGLESGGSEDKAIELAIGRQKNDIHHFLCFEIYVPYPMYLLEEECPPAPLAKRFHRLSQPPTYLIAES